MTKVYKWTSSRGNLKTMGTFKYKFIPQPDGNKVMHPDPFHFLDGECLEGWPWPEKVGGPLRA